MNTQLAGSVDKIGSNNISLPQINIDDKRKILNQLGLKNINKMKNVHTLMGKIAPN